MSVKIMAAIFESRTLGPTERLIMLALADHADDEGRCYPSIERLCQRTGLSERAVQTNVKKLKNSGYLTIRERAGRNGSNLYFVHADPAGDAPPQEMHPAADAPTPRRRCGSDPAGDAPKPSGTIIEPSEEANASLSSGDDSTSQRDEIQIAVNKFNRAAEESGWPTVRVLSKARRAALSARLRECGGLEGWAVALAKAQSSPHCCGQNDRGWTANFDFITRQSSFSKLMEGNYDARKSPKLDTQADIIALAARARRASG